jgi:hypothetical protein
MIATEPISAPVEVVTPIKPSEAIRLGCLLAPRQAFGRYGDGIEEACATKAMHLGYGDAIRAATGYYPALRSLGCPVCDQDGTYNRLAHLNDDHRWSREQIADWLEGLGL